MPPRPGETDRLQQGDRGGGHSGVGVECRNGSEAGRRLQMERRRHGVQHGGAVEPSATIPRLPTPAVRDTVWQVLGGVGAAHRALRNTHRRHRPRGWNPDSVRDLGPDSRRSAHRRGAPLDPDRRLGVPAWGARGGGGGGGVCRRGGGGRLAGAGQGLPLQSGEWGGCGGAASDARGHLQLGGRGVGRRRPHGISGEGVRRANHPGVAQRVSQLLAHDGGVLGDGRGMLQCGGADMRGVG
mmetsp:Transcript_12772/g.29844  ORF Transcript_12772/g.29844 Transcript_12772/m.29844 type:complete len:240 (+) Transcript_12772:200-919(+)